MRIESRLLLVRRSDAMVFTKDKPPQISPYSPMPSLPLIQTLYKLKNGLLIKKLFFFFKLDEKLSKQNQFVLIS